jgi:hypothetical protein
MEFPGAPRGSTFKNTEEEIAAWRGWWLKNKDQFDDLNDSERNPGAGK